jgi:hypothetical protein
LLTKPSLTVPEVEADFTSLIELVRSDCGKTGQMLAKKQYLSARINEVRRARGRAKVNATDS